MARPKLAIPQNPNHVARNMWARAQKQIDEGVRLQTVGRVDEAVEIYQSILKTLPRHPDALHLMGVALHAKGEYAQALELVNQAIDIYDQVAFFFNTRAVCLVGLRKYEEALEAVDHALAMDPKLADAINNKALILPHLQRWQEAIDFAKEYLKLQPENHRAWFNVAVSMQEYGQHLESLPYYEKSIELYPNQPHSYVNMANAHKEMANWAEAQRLLTIAEEIDPDFAETYNVKGTVLKEIGKPRASLDYYTRAQELDPLKAKTYEYNRSLSQLLLGIMPHGWINYEHRWSVIDMPLALAGYMPWMGEDLTNKILLITREQGQGDSIQFSRYIPLIKARWPTCTIKVNVDAGLDELIKTVEGIDEMLPSDNRPINLTWDYWVPMLSLPWIFQTRIDTIPCQIPYIHPPQDSVDQWAHRVDKTKLNVGLVWSGGFRKDEPIVWSVNKRRNCDWDLFEQMVLTVKQQRPDIEFYSLQKGNPAEGEFKARLEQANLPVVNLMDDVKNWVDTASLVSNLDLVISVDTSMVHLAGAIGRPVWMMNRLDTCWRWMLRRTDSPWYPSLRIFRQTKPKDWQHVLDEIVKNLLDLKK